MNLRLVTWSGIAGALALALALARAFPSDPPAEKSHKLANVSLRKLADSLRAVILADRDAYLERVVAKAGANPQDLPSHAVLLRTAAQEIQRRGAEFSYTLRSLTPAQERNGPQTVAEQEGLAWVAQHPTEPRYVEEELGGRSYFTAIYADRATHQACAECHNRHPRRPRDCQLGDVLGALVVRVPLEF